MNARSERDFLKMLTNWRIGLAIAATSLFVYVLTQSTDLHEIHRADQTCNFSLADAHPTADDWPWVRGSDSTNIARTGQIQSDWTPGQHSGWQVPLPGDGVDSPCLWGDRLFSVSTELPSRSIKLLCLSRTYGQRLWQTELHRGTDAAQNDQTIRPGHVSVTPACDGQNIFTVANDDGKLWLTAVDFQGKIVWQRDVGPFSSNGNYRSSPVIFKSLVIVAADREKNGYLAAVHRQTGEIIWRVKRPPGESHGSPTIGVIAGKPQLLLGGNQSVMSYDPATGDRLWTCRVAAERFSNCIAFDANRVYASFSKPKDELICIEADGRGDVNSARVLWRLPNIASELTSPICRDGMVYVLAEDGRLSCVRSETGAIEWIKRIPGEYVASPVIAGEFVVCANRSGSVNFVKTGNSTSPNVIERHLSAGIGSSPVIVGDSIFIQTTSHLHRIDPATSIRPIVELPTPNRRRL